MAKTVIGIDPGKGGGIAVYKNGFASAVAMPDTIRRLNEYVKFLRESNTDVIVFLEKVQAWESDDDTDGLKYGINKLLASYEQIKTILIINEMPYIDTYPQSWQSPLLLPKGMSKGERKIKYKEFAMQQFPEAKVNLKTSDALCIVYYGMQKIVSDIRWVNQKIVEFQSAGLFD